MYCISGQKKSIIAGLNFFSMHINRQQSKFYQELNSQKLKYHSSVLSGLLSGSKATMYNLN